MLNYKIYALIIKQTNEIRYIGLTKNSLKRRLKGHKEQCNKKDTYKDRWIRSIGKDNIDIILIEENIENLEKANEREVFYISYYKNKGCSLVNSTDGGDGTAGRLLTEEQKNHLRLLNKGKKLSEEHKEKMRMSALGKVVSEKTKIKRKKIFRERQDKIIKMMKEILDKKLKYNFINSLNDKTDIFIFKCAFNRINRENKKIEKKNILLNEIKIRENRKKDLKEKKQKMSSILNLLNVVKKCVRKKERIKNNPQNYINNIYIGNVMGEKQKEAIRMKNTGKLSPLKGIKRDPEIGRKIGEKQRGKIISEETREKLRQINLGKKYSEETKKKHSLHVRGNGNNCAILDVNKVLEIRDKIANGLKTRMELSKEYNMEYSTICKIIKRQLWKHI